MGIRTVRLDDEAERTLAKLRKMTGFSISEVFKRGLTAYRSVALRESGQRPYDIYCRLDLGEGGYAIAPAKEAKSAVVNAIKRKHTP